MVYVGPVLNQQEQADARELFNQGRACQHCGGIHARACPRVRELEWNDKGQLRRVMYWANNEWLPAKDIIWPEDCYEEEDARE